MSTFIRLLQSPLEVSVAHPLLSTEHPHRRMQTQSCPSVNTTEDNTGHSFVFIILKKGRKREKCSKHIHFNGTRLAQTERLNSKMLSFEVFLKPSVSLRNQINPVTQNLTVPEQPKQTWFKRSHRFGPHRRMNYKHQQRMPGMAGHSSHIGSMSDVGHLASGKDSKQRKGPCNGVYWMNLSMSCALRHPASPDPNLHSQDKYLCHHSPSVPGHKLNLSSIILVQRYNFPPPSNEFRTSEQARDGTSLNMTKYFGILIFFVCGYYLYKMTWSHTPRKACQLDKWLTVTFIATVGPYKVQAVEGVKLRVFVSLKWPRLTTLYDNVPTVHQLNWHLNLSVALQMPTFFGEQILFNVHSLWVIVHVREEGWFSGGREWREWGYEWDKEKAVKINSKINIKQAAS